MLDVQVLLTAGAILLAFVAGKMGPRWRLGSRPKWQPSNAQRSRHVQTADRPTVDAADQLRIVMQAAFERQKLLSREEARVFQHVERAVASAGLRWRTMAQVSLGEVLKTPDSRAYSTINSKRVDILLISSSGDPIAAIEYQGSGHHLGTAAARDAVKREALRRAGIAFVEIAPGYTSEDVAREVERLAKSAALAA